VSKSELQGIRLKRMAFRRGPSVRRAASFALFVSLLIVVALIVTACGGTTRTKTVTVTDENSQTTSEAVTTQEKADKGIVVEQSRLIYQPTATGGRFHVALVLLKNTSNETAVDVGGQLSILDERNRLVESIDVTPVTILPHGDGLIEEQAVDLPRALPKGRLDIALVVDHTQSGGVSPVSFSRLRYKRSTDYGFATCTISGVVSNRFTERKENLQLRVAGFVGKRLATGGLTYVDNVFPGRDATFKVDFFDAATCPKGVDRVVVLPNLSEDKIYNP
jgi:hypothetical protein